jgi:prolyl oligopeptidase
VTDAADTLFGQKVSDPYRWLEDVDNPEVKAWMEAEDAAARSWLTKLPGRDAIEARLKALFYVDSVRPPVHRGGRYFYMRTHADREKAILYWKDGEDGAEQVLIDPNTLSADGSVALGGWVPSYDGKLLAYLLRPNNADEATLYVKEVATGQVHGIDTIDGAKYARPEWTPSGDGFYYTWLPTDPSIAVAERPGYAEVRFHKLGTAPSSDRLIHPKTGNPKEFLGTELSRDGRWLFIYRQHGWTSNDVYFRDLTSKDTAFKPLVVGRDAHFYVTAWKDDFYIQSDDGAPHNRLYKVGAKNPAREKWQEIVPEPGEAVIESVQIIGDHLVITLLRNAANELEVRTLDGHLVRTVPLPGIGATEGMTGNPDEDDAYFSFTSFTHPLEVYRTSIKTGDTRLWASVKLPIDPSRFQVEQVWYPSKDGTKVSMFLVHRKDLPRDGSTPFLIGGYGGFNVSMVPSFAGSLFPWLEAGGGYALPNLRGGGEYGEAWHRDGMLDKKQNVFDDYIGAAEYLIREGYTKPERLAIKGGSNGGLLVGAAMVQRPDLYRAVICAVPLLDMVRYHLFGSGKTWISEYGSAEDEAQFKTLFAYSPYHHVKPGTAYPSMLMLSADHDDRVDPMHARKFVAAVQAANIGDHPILMRIEINAGHGGADLVKKTVEQAADTYAFLMHELGLMPAGASGGGAGSAHPDAVAPEKK